jgi:hypothetical protein
MIEVKMQQKIKIFNNDCVNAAKLLLLRGEKLSKTNIIKLCKSRYDINGYTWSMKLDEYVKTELNGLDRFTKDANDFVDTFYWNNIEHAK